MLNAADLIQIEFLDASSHQHRPVLNRHGIWCLENIATDTTLRVTNITPAVEHFVFVRHNQKTIGCFLLTHDHPSAEVHFLDVKTENGTLCMNVHAAVNKTGCCREYLAPGQVWSTVHFWYTIDRSFF